jgi:hypothetical protein
MGMRRREEMHAMISGFMVGSLRYAQKLFSSQVTATDVECGDAYPDFSPWHY